MSEARVPEFLVVDCGSRKVPDIGRILSGIGVRVRTVPLDQVDPAALSAADAVVISGGPALFTDPGGDRTVARFRFLDDLTVPVLGICLGHQALALRAGGSAFRGPERRDRDVIEPVENHPLLAGIAAPVVMREDHCEGVSAPEGFRVVARSAHYENEMMVSRDGRRIGVQFHPEASGEPGEVLFRNFVAFVREIGGGAWTS